MIELEHLCKRFGAVTAVADVSLRAGDGRILGLLGPNGAGKTTTLRIVSTLLAPGGGSARVDGRDVASAPLEARRRIGIVAGGGALYPRLTAREHIRYFGALHGIARRELEQRIARLIETLGMTAIADRRAAGFSQGERMKVAIARAIVHEPQNLLLDEPTNGLDVISTRALRELVRRFRAEGKCVILSTHVMQEIAALCDDIVVIAHGRVVASGAPDALRAQTGKSDLEDAFVSLIGSAEGLV